MTLSKFDNRTDPLFQGTTNTNSINLGITTRCSMSCPKCSVGVPREKESGHAQDVPYDQIKGLTRYFSGLRRIHVTGGEPTIHHQFASISNLLRMFFKPEYLTLETNGAGFRVHHRNGTLSHYDRVFMTHYERDSVYPGSPDNSHILDYAETVLGDKLIREPPVKHDRAHLIQIGQDITPCSKFFEPGLPAGWYNGKLYACCVTFGIDPSLGIDLTDNWKEEIEKASMGCRFCLYQGT